VIKRIFKALLFFPYYVKEVLVSNIRVAGDVLRKTPKISPGIVAVPLDIKSDFGIFALSNAITMTPGTLTMDVSRDKKWMYVHSLYIDDPKVLKADIKNGFERRLREIYD
jgi:multicomponent Na+:H+ antiporter subunit E